MSFKYDDMEVTIWNKNEHTILCGRVKSIARFGVVRDYTIELKRGQVIELHTGVVETIAHEWIRQNKDEAAKFFDSVKVSP